MHRTCSWVPHTGEPLPTHITPQRAARLQGLHDYFPFARVISIAERGPGDRVTPRDWEVVYVMAGRGPYGRPAEVRLGTELASQSGRSTILAAELGF